MSRHTDEETARVKWMEAVRHANDLHDTDPATSQRNAYAEQCLSEWIAAAREANKPEDA